MQKKTVVSPQSFTTFGDLLRFLRTRVELSQRDLALRVGYHYSHLNRFEKNLRPPPDSAILMAQFIPALGLDKEPEWTSRLLELASTKGQIIIAREPHEPVSVANVYRLPTSLVSTIGREQETAQLAKLLLQSNIRLVTLVGPPGVGKTHTALHVGEKISHHFSSGALFVNLTPVDKPEMVLHVFAAALGLLETSTTPSLRMLQSFLQDKNLLIVMDNFEQVLPAASYLTDLLSAAPEIKILATSREALRIQGEREFLLSPLPVPHESQIDSSRLADEFPAIELFVQRAVAVQPNFQLTEENASLIADICRRLDGLPLAIELAAARIQSLSLSEMIAQFDRLFDWLTRGRRDTPAWRQTLLGTIEWSYGLLSEPERRLFARLAVFSGGWTLEAAEGICCDDDLLARNKILGLLSQLVDRSLVVTDINEGRTHYRLLDTIFHFAQGKLKESMQWEEFRNRHLEYFSGWAGDLETMLERESPLQLRSHMDAETNNIRAALDWGLNKHEVHKQALALAGSAGMIWLKHSHFKEALDWVTKYLPVSEDQSDSHARLLFLATALSYWRDNLNDGLAYGQAGLEVARSVGNKREQAGILYYLGELHRERGDLVLARQSVEESVSLYREINNSARLSLALTTLGIILYRMGDRPGAQSALDEALELAIKENSLWGQSYTLRVQADNLRFGGKFTESYLAYERALAVSTEIDDRISMGMELANMSLVTNVLEDYAASAYYAKKAFSLFQAIGNEYQQPFPLRMLAYAQIQQADLQSARVHCMESLKGNKSLGHKTGVIACLICLASLIHAEGNSSAARSLLNAIQAEIAAHSISLMEPDAKALVRLQRELGKTRPKTKTPLEFPSEIAQYLDEIGLNS